MVNSDPFLYFDAKTPEIIDQILFYLDEDDLWTLNLAGMLDKSRIHRTNGRSTDKLLKRISALAPKGANRYSELQPSAQFEIEGDKITDFWLVAQGRAAIIYQVQCCYSSPDKCVIIETQTR